MINCMRLAFLLLVFVIPAGSVVAAQDAYLSKFQADKICAVSLLRNSIRTAGSFFGSSPEGYFLLESGATGFGPILMKRKRNSTSADSSSIYLASSVNADCRSMSINFERVDKVGPYAFQVKKHSPPDRIKMVAFLINGVPQEGEFSKIDLNAKFESQDQAILYRAQRGASNFLELKKLYTDSGIPEMINEMCLLIVGAVAEEDSRKECIDQTSGGWDR